MNPEIQPVVKIGGSAFQDNSMNSNRPLSCMRTREPTKLVSLADWCSKNFISRDIGYTLIKKKLLIGVRQFGYWWVRSNPDCLEELLEYLDVEELIFDVDSD